MTSPEKRLVYRYVQDESLAYKKWISIKKSQADEETEVIEKCLKELVYLHTVPRMIVCVDEKYIRHCLEMIHISAGNSSLQKSSSKSGVLLEGFVFPLAEEEYYSGTADCFAKWGSENADSSVDGHWIIGSISGSKSVKNILEHPMLSRVGVEDGVELEFPDSGSHSVVCLPQKLNRFDEMFRTSIDLSDDRLSGLGVTVTHGMLEGTLTDGAPHYVFSVEEMREVYETSLISTGSPSNGVMQWMYSFNLHSRTQKELSHVGTMKVSAHFSSCPNNFKFLETEFILYGFDEKTKVESISDPLSQSSRMKKGLSKKFASTFKPSLSVRKRSKSVFWRNSSVTDSCPWPPPTEVHIPSGKKIQPYSETASVIIRKHVNIPPKEVAAAEPGGWGSSILKRVAQKETNTFQTSLIPSKGHCQCNDEKCSTVDIIIPAGYHGQPEMGDGGNVPSSLIERWKSGGQCDCGGWDMGCPLTVFTTRPNKTGSYGDLSKKYECCSFDTVLKGTEGRLPQMKMLNISNDLYHLDFRSSLSALQCFAIAVAVLHCSNSALQTQTLQELETQGTEVSKDFKFPGNEHSNNHIDSKD